MAEMEMIIVVQTEEDPSPQSYTGAVVSEAQAFTTGVSGTLQSVQCRMRCTTPDGEAHEMQRSAVDEACEPTLTDIEDWLTANAAYE
jgi:hypothetical protein